MNHSLSGGILSGLMLLMSCMGVSANTDVYLRLGVGIGQYDASGDYPGRRGETGFSEADFAGLLGLGVRYQEQFTLEVSRLNLELLPFLDDVVYGVDGYATRFLAGYQHPLNDWAHLGVQAGVMHWSIGVKPSISRSTQQFTGSDPYYGALLRLGNRRAGFLVGYDFSSFDGIDYKLGWLGLEVAFGGN